MHSFAASWFPHNRRWAGGLVGVADKRVPTEGSDFEPRRDFEPRCARPPCLCFAPGTALGGHVASRGAIPACDDVARSDRRGARVRRRQPFGGRSVRMRAVLLAKLSGSTRRGLHGSLGDESDDFCYGPSRLPVFVLSALRPALVAQR
jgi:hypothetical protein